MRVNTTGLTNVTDCGVVTTEECLGVWVRVPLEEGRSEEPWIHLFGGGWGWVRIPGRAVL